MNHFTKNQKGFSLIEAMIAATILTSVVFLFTYFSSQSQRKVKSSLHTICQNLADASLNKIRALGYGSSLTGVDFANNTVNVDMNTLSSYLHNADRANPNIPAYTPGGSGHIVQSYQSIVGSMFLLNRIYNTQQSAPNNQSAVCGSTRGIQYPTLLENTDPSGRLANVTTYMRVRTQDLSSGNKGCEGQPFYIRPGGTNINPLDGVDTPPNSSTDHGYYVKVTTEYTDPKDASNTIQSCSSSAVFAYPKQNLVAEATTSFSAQIIVANTNAICSEYAPQSILRITPPDNYDKRLGLLLFCRDRSIPTVPPASGPGGPGLPGFPGRGRGGPGSYSGECPTSPQPTTFTTNNNFVPCDQVTLCAQAPTPASTINPTTGQVNNVYNTIPLGCEYRVEVQVVDEAMNTRTTPVFANHLPAPMPECNPCVSPRPNGPGYCPPGTLVSECNPPSPPGGGGGGGGDGSDGGDDGRGGDGSNG